MTDTHDEDSAGKQGNPGTASTPKSGAGYGDGAEVQKSEDGDAGEEKSA